MNIALWQITKMLSVCFGCICIFICICRSMSCFLVNLPEAENKRTLTDKPSMQSSVPTWFFFKLSVNAFEIFSTFSYFIFLIYLQAHCSGLVLFPNSTTFRVAGLAKMMTSFMNTVEQPLTEWRTRISDQINFDPELKFRHFFRFLDF